MSRWRNMNHLDMENIRHYLYAVVRSRCIDHLRRTAKHKAYVDYAAMMSAIATEPDRLDEAVREAESRLLGVETNITNWQRRQNANNNFSATVPYDMEQQKKEMKEFLEKSINNSKGIYRALVGQSLWMMMKRLKKEKEIGVIVKEKMKRISDENDMLINLFKEKERKLFRRTKANSAATRKSSSVSLAKSHMASSNSKVAFTAFSVFQLPRVKVAFILALLRLPSSQRLKKPILKSSPKIFASIFIVLAATVGRASIRPTPLFVSRISRPVLLLLCKTNVLSNKTVSAP